MRHEFTLRGEWLRQDGFQPEVIIATATYIRAYERLTDCFVTYERVRIIARNIRDGRDNWSIAPYAWPSSPHGGSPPDEAA